MAEDDIYALHLALKSWPTPLARKSDFSLSDACLRLLDAIEAMSSGRTGWADIAGLVRQVLLTTGVRLGGHPHLLMREGRPWPTVEQWARVGCTAVPTTEGRVRVTAHDWEPNLGDGEACDLAGEQVRQSYGLGTIRDYTEIPADPFWTEAHRLPTYRGEAQRQAARAVVLAEGGEALVLTLPTGRGKTAVVWSKMLLATEGVTLVVVPTVVLALDMERRTKAEAESSGRDLSPVNRYAYTGGLDAESKRLIREAVRSGTQRILYTSPEAVVSGLAPAILDCARAGHLQQIVIDEAHLVEQWGQDFRPEFQTMAGLFRAALERAPRGSQPELVLMSATLTTRQIDVLRETFAPRSDALLVWGASLRQEPAYFVQEFPDPVERDEHVVAAVRHLPRPLILYATRVDDAERWQNRLRAEGFQRVGLVTGRSTEEQRRSAVEKWRGQATDGSPIPTAYDVVVGTSAFGLGIDVSNVRTVIHACVPETIDRFYQEVGRAGRDGHPTVAVLYSCRSDWDLARRLNSVTLIGDKKGLRRWHALRNAMEPLSETRFRVRRSTLPTYLEEGFGQSAAWNLKTLSLMAQAGIIQFSAPSAPLRSAGMTEEEWQEVLETFWGEAADLVDFELLSGSKLEDGAWKVAMQAARDVAEATRKHSFAAIQSVVGRNRCVGDVLADYYSVEEAGALLRITPSCRGCPWCRTHPEHATGLALLEPAPLLPTGHAEDPLAPWRGQEHILHIWWDGEEERLIEQLLVLLVRRGLRVASNLEPADGLRLQAKCLPYPVVADYLLAPQQLAATWPGPLMHVQVNDQLDSQIEDRRVGNMTTYVIGPATLQDPRKPGWLLRDTVPAIRLTALLREF